MLDVSAKKKKKVNSIKWHLTVGKNSYGSQTPDVFEKTPDLINTKSIYGHARMINQQI